MKFKFKLYFTAVLLLVASSSAFSYTECMVKTSRLYIGDNGSLWMVFERGGVAYMRHDDVDFEGTYSLLLSAQIADRNVSVRFQEDNVLCNTGIRSDVVGVWLIK